MIVFTSASSPYDDAGTIVSYDLDSAYGSDENDFELGVPENTVIPQGAVWYIDGTEYGGIVDTIASVQEHGQSKRTYKGRTFQGMLAGKVISPPSGSAYWAFSSKDANTLIGEVIAAIGLSSVFSASAEESIGITGRFDRYIDAYSGLCKVLRANGLRLSRVWASGKCLLAAVDAVTYVNTVDSDLVAFDIERTYRPINHLVCLGSGELASRLVRHVYADASGNVSTTQSLTGIDEVAEVYDYDNVDDASELISKGTEKLKGCQGQGEVQMSITPFIEFFIGDQVVAQDNDFGITATATVTKKIIDANGGYIKISYEIGTPDEEETDY